MTIPIGLLDINSFSELLRKAYDQILSDIENNPEELDDLEQRIEFWGNTKELFDILITLRITRAENAYSHLKNGQEPYQDSRLDLKILCLQDNLVERGKFLK